VKDVTDKTSIMRKLFNQISHCRNVRLCFEEKKASHPCRNIVMSQKTILSEFKVPEPWSGHLDRATILFLGSNPSISSNVRNPRWSSSNSMIRDYFINRFGGGREEWVRDGIHVLDSGGKYDKSSWVRY
jgi:hypothetical protein